MEFYCSKCEKPAATLDKDPVTDGYIMSCPECGGPVAFVSYEEFEAPEPIMFSDDEARYLLHLVEKQQDKLINAFQQLESIASKLYIPED